MYFEITDNTSFREIQDVFARFYPWLRLRFYKRAHRKYNSSSDKDEINCYLKVGEFKKTHVSGILEILPLNKISDVEKELQVRFGLPVQILMKEKDRWEQTTGMDAFTLKDANELSRNASDDFVVSDYEEGFSDNEPG